MTATVVVLNLVFWVCCVAWVVLYVCNGRLERANGLLLRDINDRVAEQRMLRDQTRIATAQCNLSQLEKVVVEAATRWVAVRDTESSIALTKAVSIMKTSEGWRR